MGDGQYGDTRFLDQQADAGAEAGHLPVFGELTFREEEDIEAVVEGIAGVGEAALEVAHARQREDVEEQCGEEVVQWAEDGKAVVARADIRIAEVAIVLEHFAGHGDGESAADGAGKPVGEDWAVPLSDVVGDDDHGLVRIEGSVGLAEDGWVGEKGDQRNDDCFHEG